MATPLNDTEVVHYGENNHVINPPSKGGIEFNHPLNLEQHGLNILRLFLCRFFHCLHLLQSVTGDIIQKPGGW